MTQKNEETKKGENSASDKIEVQTTCQRSCKICNSENLELIHSMRKNGDEYKKIVSEINNQFDEQISESSLCRHFTKYQKNIVSASAQFLEDDILEKATMQSVHLLKVVELIDLALTAVKLRMKTNSYNVDISDLDKLMNMRYKLLTGESDSDDLVALFQRASKDHGFQQAIVFKT